MMKDFIEVRGAREHNLQNITVKIPKHKLVVFSGVSGSGKTSLALDTLYAEGHRRYVESLSAYARQFLGMLPRPDVDSITGLAPAIAIDQHGLSGNPRSTVGTVTEIYDFLRVLYARVGQPHCPKCGREVARQTSDQIVGQVLKLVKEEMARRPGQPSRFLLLAPVVRDKRGEFNSLFENLKNKGFRQVRIDGWIYDLGQTPVLIKTNRHRLDVVVDRVSAQSKKLAEKSFRQRLKDDVEISLEMSAGFVIMAIVKDAAFSFPEKPTKMEDRLFSSQFACPDCNLSLPEIEPRLFSFNSPFGACPKCNGLGVILKIDRSRVSGWRAADLERRYYRTTSEVVREEIEKLMIKQVCPDCGGTRLRQSALKVTLQKQSIAQIAAKSLVELKEWVDSLSSKLTSKQQKEVAQVILDQIGRRLDFLVAVGVGYLSLSRQASTLSAGEGQRIRLASQMGSGLTGVLYILDEPTVGLHPRDTQQLIKMLKSLRDLGNTLVVVEHDKEILAAADWILDFGPGAGSHGGRLVAAGTPQQIKQHAASLTGRFLAGKDKMPARSVQPKKVNRWLKLTGCQTHNLKNVDLLVPLARLVCVTGVSGSGKSSLITDTLYPALKRALNKDCKEQLGEYRSLEGVANVSQVMLVDQAPVGRTSRSNPATYTGVFTEIRRLFAQTREAKRRGFGQTYFSFNTEGGRCEACQGQGQLRVQMQFLPDLWVECEQCHGDRFQAEVLEVEYKDKNISQVLGLTVSEALEFFKAVPTVTRRLKVLEKIGLGYLRLGQPSPTLSGGESQRLKLARELVKRSEGKTVYLLDEPTVGLHFEDLKKLVVVLRTLVERGDTVIIIEHNLDLISQADWIIDLGPEGGEAGGRIIAEGPPRRISQNPHSWTGKYLNELRS